VDSDVYVWCCALLEKKEGNHSVITVFCVHYVQIWQKVKAANQNFTVCEIGATIGRLWREMTDVDKQQYNDDFAVDKVRQSCE